MRAIAAGARGYHARYFQKLFCFICSLMARRHVFLPGFPSVIFRVDSEIGGLPSDLPAVVKDLIAESRAAVQDGRLISPLGLAVVSGGHLSVTITNGYGERHWVTLCIRP